MFKKLIVAAVLALVGSPATAEEDERTWEGKWSNRKYGTSGPLKCVATRDKAGTWTATFSGEFRGSPFSYQVKFTGKEARQQEKLSGKATIQGHYYDWAGLIKGDQLIGQYRSRNGNNGPFVLKEKK